MRRLSPIAAALVALLPCAAARAEGEEVDVALVMAVDVSLSMTPEEQRIQREGYVEAFRSDVVQGAIRQGLNGRIAVAYVEWAGVSSQAVVVPWTVVGTPEEANGFADRLAKNPPRRSTWTSIAGALDFSANLLRDSGVAATRRVIDVSGDGPNNQGRDVTQARDDVVAQGIVINGLPLMIREPTGPWDIPDLDRYYRECVIGGPGAFMVPVRERAQFAQAIRTKIVREVAAVPPDAVVIPAQASSAPNCTVVGRGYRDWP
jgi:hypothetical protein